MGSTCRACRSPPRRERPRPASARRRTHPPTPAPCTRAACAFGVRPGRRSGLIGSCRSRTRRPRHRGTRNLDDGIEIVDGDGHLTNRRAGSGSTNPAVVLFGGPRGRQRSAEARPVTKPEPQRQPQAARPAPASPPPARRRPNRRALPLRADRPSGPSAHRQQQSRAAVWWESPPILRWRSGRHVQPRTQPDRLQRPPRHGRARLPTGAAPPGGPTAATLRFRRPDR